MGGQAEEGERVVLLHGLWRSMGAMAFLEKELQIRGYETVNVPYASMTKRVEETAEWLEEELGRAVESGERVHFVTHSLGGAVLRELLARGFDLGGGKVVMLAPPNQGSAIVDWLGIWGRMALGPACEWLSEGGGSQRGAAGEGRPRWPVEVPLGVLMGRKSVIPVLRTFLGEENDGIVSVEEGALEGAADFKVVDADHTLIMREEFVLDEVLHFLKEGMFLLEG